MQIRNFLGDELARAAHHYFEQLPPDEWTVAVQSGEEAVYFRDLPENWEEIASAQEHAHRSFEQGKFSYSFRRTFEDHEVGCACAECRVRATLGSSAMLALLGRCGLTVGALGEVFASCYSPGSFLSPHTDRGNGTVGFSLNLSPRSAAGAGWVAHVLATRLDDRAACDHAEVQQPLPVRASAERRDAASRFACHHGKAVRGERMVSRSHELRRQWHVKAQHEPAALPTG